MGSRVVTCEPRELMLTKHHNHQKNTKKDKYSRTRTTLMMQCVFCLFKGVPFHFWPSLTSIITNYSLWLVLIPYFDLHRTFLNIQIYQAEFIHHFKPSYATNNRSNHQLLHRLAGDRTQQAGCQEPPTVVPLGRGWWSSSSGAYLLGGWTTPIMLPWIKNQLTSEWCYHRVNTPMMLMNCEENVKNH